MTGFAVRHRRALLAERARQQAAHARTEERLRIAREVHDVVAHAMSLIAMQAGVGQYIARTKPEEAEHTLASIADTSRGALAEIRLSLGALRQTGEPGDTGCTPSPGVGRLSDLAAATTASGVTVALETTGERRELSPAVDAACYRIVQEAVTNVVKHSGADACQVRVEYTEEAILVGITDPGPSKVVEPPGPGDRSGYGLTGMRERARLLGGALDAGPRAEGGFGVLARLPLQVES